MSTACFSRYRSHPAALSSPRKPTKSCNDRPSRSTDHAATTSILRRTTAFRSRSNSGRLSRPLAPLMPSSGNSSVIAHPCRRPIASVRAWRWLSTVCPFFVETRRYSPTRLGIHSHTIIILFRYNKTQRLSSEETRHSRRPIRKRVSVYGISAVAALTLIVPSTSRSGFRADLEKWLPVVFNDHFILASRCSPEAFCLMSLVRCNLIPVTTETNCAISRYGIGSIRVARTGS